MCIYMYVYIYIYIYVYICMYICIYEYVNIPGVPEKNLTKIKCRLICALLEILF